MLISILLAMGWSEDLIDYSARGCELYDVKSLCHFTPSFVLFSLRVTPCLITTIFTICP